MGEQISKNELDRRWKAVRDKMAKAEIDSLVMYNTNQALGGYVRYFTDIPAGTYGVTVIFPIDNEITVISSGAPQTIQRPSHGLKKQILQPRFPTFNFTDSAEAKAVVETLREDKAKSVGFVSKASLSSSIYEYVRENLKGVEMRDATDLVDEIKAVKSEEEIDLIKKSVELHDNVFEAILDFIEPGLKDFEIDSEIRRLASDMGSEYQAGSVSSAPAGMIPKGVPKHLQTRELKRGDQVRILIEVNGFGGYYGEIARTVCLGVAPSSLLSLWGVSVEVQERTAELMKTGAKPTEILADNNKLLVSKGFQPVTRLYSHGQGYDMVERPGIMPGEKMTLKEGMYIAIHPETIDSKEAHANCCDNFLVTDKGTIRLTKTPREVFIV